MFFYPDIFAWTVNPEMSLPYASSMKLFVLNMCIPILYYLMPTLNYFGGRDTC